MSEWRQGAYGYKQKERRERDVTTLKRKKMKKNGERCCKETESSSRHGFKDLSIRQYSRPAIFDIRISTHPPQELRTGLTFRGKKNEREKKRERWRTFSFMSPVQEHLVHDLPMLSHRESHQYLCRKQHEMENARIQKTASSSSGVRVGRKRSGAREHFWVQWQKRGMLQRRERERTAHR